jgi:phytoene dehydrogenase-like protein
MYYKRRVVPETIARFLTEAGPHVALALKPVAALPHAFDPERTPVALRRYEQESDWRLPVLAARYPRLSTERETAEAQQGRDHRQVHAADDEAVQLERRIAQHLGRVEAHPDEQRERGDRRPERAASCQRSVAHTSENTK